MSTLYRVLALFTLLLFLDVPVVGQPTDRQGDALPPGAAMRMGTTRLRQANAITSVAFTADGKGVYAADYGEGVCLWEMSSGKKLFDLPPRTGHLVALSPDGKVLAVGGFNGVTLRHPTTGEKIRAVTWTERSQVRAFAFAPDSKTLAVVGGKEVSLCDVATGQETRQLKGHKLAVWSVAFSPDGKQIATGDSTDRASIGQGIQGDTTIILWDATTGQEVRRIEEAHHGWTYSLSFSADSRMLAAASPYKVRLWDATTGKHFRDLDQANSFVAFSPKGDHFLAGRGLAVINPATGQATAKMPGAEEVRCAAYSPNGELVASGGSDGLIRLWNAETGREVTRQVGHEQAVKSVAFSPDGMVVASASGGDKTVRVWGTASGAQLRKINIGCTTASHWCQDRDARNLYFSPDGSRLVTWSCDGVVHLWDLTTGRSREFPIGSRWIGAVALSADGRMLASSHSDGGSRTYLSIFDTASGKETQKFLPYDEKAVREVGITSLAFSPDGKTLALGGVDRRGVDRDKPSQETIVIWDLTTSKKLRGFRPGMQSPVSLLFTPDGQHLISAPNWNSPLQIWEVGTGQEVRKITVEPDNNARDALPVALSADGKVLASASGKDHRIILWEMATGQEIRRLAGHTKSVTALAFAQDGKSLVSGSADTTVLVWPLDFREKKAPEKPKEPKQEELEQAFQELASPDALTAYRAIQTLADAGEKSIALLQKQLKPAPARALKELPRLIADLSSTDLKVRESAVHELRQYGAPAEPALYEALRAKPSREVRVQLERLLEAINEWPIAPEDLRHQRAIQALERMGSPAAEQVLKMLADGAPTADPTRDTVAALKRLDARRSLKVVKVLTEEGIAEARQHLVGGKEPRALAGHTGSLIALAYSPDGKMLASAGKDGSVQLWDSATGQKLRRLAAKGGLHGLAFSRDGKILATAGVDGQVRLWNVADATELGRLEGHVKDVVCVVFSPDGKILASGGYDGNVRLWDVEQKQPLRNFKTEARKVTSITFSLDGKTLASGGLLPEQNPFAGGISYTQPAPIQLWNVANGKELTTLPIRGSDVAFARDGRTLIAAGVFVLIDRNVKRGGFIAINDDTCYSATRIYWWDLTHQTEIRHHLEHGSAFVLSPDGRMLACVDGHQDHHDPFMWNTNTIGTSFETGHSLRLLENATGKQVLRASAGHGRVTAFAPDGQTVAWGDDQGMIFLWELTPTRPLAQFPNGAGPKDLEALGRQLASEDAEEAYQAVWTLAAAGKSAAAFLKEQLRPVIVDDQRIQQLIADLSNDEFAARENATKELAKLGTAAEPALVQAREKKLPAEAKRRVDELLKDIFRSELSPEELRHWRAIQVLEKCGSPEARSVLETLSKGSPLARRTLDARQALERMTK